MRDSVLLTPTEWKLMECLWASSPRTGRQAAEYMKKSALWSRSTTLTMCRETFNTAQIICIVLIVCGIAGLKIA